MVRFRITVRGGACRSPVPALVLVLGALAFVVGCSPAIQPSAIWVDSAAVADSGEVPLADGSTASDASLPDDATPDASVQPDVPACVADGGPRCPCTANVDCDSGLCIDYADSKRCAVPCTTDGACLPDEGCVQSTSGGDVAQFCAPRYAALCSPCQQDSDCRVGVYAGTPTCYPAGAQGSYCSVPCSADSPCPAGYVCPGQLGYCALIAGECGCSGWAVTHSATTQCVSSNPFGDCSAKRTCSALGLLPACAATTAVAEACNGQDDNCNGLTDDGADTTCNDSDACTTDYCAGGQCVHPSVINCGDGSCASDCGETTGNCPVDCHVCGDGLCQPGEGPKSCAGDCCGSCGDGKCVGYECGEDKVGGPKQCAADCGTACGNQVCDKGESPSTCPSDCIKQVCGNHVCEPGDGGPVTCPADCAPGCGNCVCEKGESSDDCPVDCGVCGDGVCSLCDGLGESPVKCAVDCPIKPACTLWPGLCNDGSPCTTDTCVDGKGCVHTPTAGEACDDGSVCTKDDVCGADGVCKGAGLDCNDGNLCTTDTCDASGCLHLPAVGDCSDQDACTQGDSCQGGACVAGPLNACFDNNPCTDTACVAGTCQYGAIDGACSDDNACTGPDLCKGGKCAAGPQTDCEDKELCTADKCNPPTGACDHAAVGGECTDANACTVGDTCQNKVCVPGPPNACEDGNFCTTGACVSDKCTQTNISCADTNPCTADACDINSGCTHSNLGTNVSCGTNMWCSGTGKCGACNAEMPCPAQAPGSVYCTSLFICGCTPISKAAACGSKTCGTQSIGCLKTVSCGTCTGGQICSFGNCITPCAACANAKLKSVCEGQGLQCCGSNCQ